jgi:hypothetical protein
MAYFKYLSVKSEYQENCGACDEIYCEKKLKKEFPPLKDIE